MRYGCLRSSMRLTLRGGPALTHALALAALVTIQAALGILTLLHHVPIGFALMHQAVAIIVLMLAVMHAERLTARRHSVTDAKRLMVGAGT